jgi:GNAT superfamily N-acetyltransferase
MISVAESSPTKLSLEETQRLLDEVELRLMEPEELKRWEEEMESHHYLHDARMVGQTLRYVAVHEGRWVGLIGMASASYHLRGRDQWIGWSEPQRRQRLLFVAQNARFLILPGPQAPNLASRLLGLCARRVSADFERLHGHGVLLLESFVDYQRYEGTCYRAAGWERLGHTCGFGRTGRDFYTEHGYPKELWLKALHPQAAQILRQADALPAPWAQQVLTPPLRNALHAAELQSLFDLFWQLPDSRSRQGRRHSQASVLAVATVGVLAGARTYAAMADVAAQLSQSQLRNLRCRYRTKTKSYLAPSETTIWRVLSQVEAAALDQRLGEWIARLDPLRRQAIALDGKTLRGAWQADGSQLHLLAAITHESKTVRGQRAVENRGAGSEIAAVAPLLAPLEIAGCTVTLDALHTQQPTARFLVQEKGADYVFTVKGNQPALRAKAEQILGGSAFFPSGRDH